MSHTLLLNVRFPGNLKEILFQIFEVVNFEFFDTKLLTEYLFTFSVVEKAAEKFSSAKIETKDFINYVGFDLYLFVLGIVVIIVLKTAVSITQKTGCCKNSKMGVCTKLRSYTNKIHY